MKFTAAIAALILAVAVSATAVPAPEARCRGYVGQACGKVKARDLELVSKTKRAAEAFAEALAVAEPSPNNADLAARCDMGSCYEAKMMMRDLAAIVAETTEDPTAYYDALNLEDEETSDKLKRNAEARCRGYVGQACGKKTKRNADPNADPEAEALCGVDGAPCAKLRRAAEAVAEAIPAPEARCRGYVGQACGKAKRDALALAHAVDAVLNL